MQPTTPLTPTSAIPVPDIDSDEPVAVIPVASVAPLEGRPDGERINIFTLAPKNEDSGLRDFAVNAYGEVRERVLGRPMTYVAMAFSLGFLLARLRR